MSEMKHTKWPRNSADDPHAHECYSCEFASRPPATCPACRGCISRDSRPHWVPKSAYVAAAHAALSKAAPKGEESNHG